MQQLLAQGLRQQAIMLLRLMGQAPRAVALLQLALALLLVRIVSQKTAVMLRDIALMLKAVVPLVKTGPMLRAMVRKLQDMRLMQKAIRLKLVECIPMLKVI
jgi:hypothetical protein